MVNNSSGTNTSGNLYQTSLTTNGVVYGDSSGVLNSTAAGTTGTVFIGTTSNPGSYSATPTVTSITFGAGTALSSYVQNTYSPVVAFGGASVGITYSAQTGEYTQIGNVVFVAINVTLSSKGSSTGAATISLPIATGGTTGSFTSATFSNITLTLLYTGIGGFTSASVINLTESGSAQVYQNLTDAMFANTTNIYISGFYFTS